MENPTQSLLHVTNIGDRVRSLHPSDPAKFINETTQPIRNVNKYGLLHYSIPKTLDTLQFDNSDFTLHWIQRRSDGASKCADASIRLLFGYKGKRYRQRYSIYLSVRNSTDIH